MNNNKKTIIICAIAALVILAVVIIITLVTQLTGFSIILITLFIILTICLSIYIKEAPDEFTAFIKEKKRILRTYGSVIVEVEALPNIAGKNIIKVKTIDDLVDAQLELREPIYYKNDNDSCFFLLLHYNEACVYILRMNDDVISPTEQSIRFMKPDVSDDKSNYENLLDDVENTIVFKLDELRSFKISPIRNETPFEVVDDTAIKKNLEHTITISGEELEQELAKSSVNKEINQEKNGANIEKEQETEEKIKVEEIEISSNIPEEKTSKEEKIVEAPVEKTKTSAPKSSTKPKPKKTVKKSTHANRRSSKYANK